jgi:hypothetical protein
VTGPYLPAHLDPVAIGEAHVQHGHVRSGRRDPAQRLLGGAGLADDHEVILSLEQLPQPPAHDLVIVEEKHPRHSAHLGQSR